MSKKNKKENINSEEKTVEVAEQATVVAETVNEGFFKRKWNATKGFCEKHKKAIIGTAVGVAGGLAGGLYLLNGIGADEGIEFEEATDAVESESPEDE